MGPAIGEWVQCCYGRERAKDEDGGQVLSLKTTVNIPKDELTKALLGKLHSVGANAQLHRNVQKTNARSHTNVRKTNARSHTNVRKTNARSHTNVV